MFGSCFRTLAVILVYLLTLYKTCITKPSHGIGMWRPACFYEYAARVARSGCRRIKERLRDGNVVDNTAGTVNTEKSPFNILP